MRRLICLLLLGISCNAFAVVSWAGYTYQPDAISACNSYAGHYGAVAGGISTVYVDDGTFKCYWNGVAQVNVTRQGQCLSGQVISHVDGTCSGSVCPSGQTVNSTGQCVGISCTAGTVVNSTFKTGTGSLSDAMATANRIEFPTSNGSCDVDYSVKDCYAAKNSAGTGLDFYCDFTGKMTGSVTPAGYAGAVPSSPPTTSGATPSALPPTSAPKGQNCPAGTMNIGVDSSGIPMCAGQGTDPGTPSQSSTTTTGKTTTNADGSTTTVETKASKNSDGSTTTTTTTTTVNPDGSKTVATNTSTSADAAGGNGVDDSNKDKSENVTAVSGDLYAKGTKTYSDVLTNFSNAAGNAPFVSGAKNFLSISVQSGSCPSWTASVPYLRTSINVGQYFCTSTASAALTVLGVGVMLAAAFVAFRIAFL